MQKVSTLINDTLATMPKVKFVSYYKFSFSFSGKATLANGEEVSIHASMGGNADEIYEKEIVPEVEQKLNKDDFSYIHVKNLTTGEEQHWSTW